MKPLVVGIQSTRMGIRMDTVIEMEPPSTEHAWRPFSDHMRRPGHTRERAQQHCNTTPCQEFNELKVHPGVLGKQSSQYLLWFPTLSCRKHSYYTCNQWISQRQDLQEPRLTPKGFPAPVPRPWRGRPRTCTRSARRRYTFWPTWIPSWRSATGLTKNGGYPQWC